MDQIKVGPPLDASPDENETSRSLAFQVASATVFRLFLNTARRFIYPFAPAFSRGLGVPLTAITSLIALNQVTGLMSLLFGPLSDRWGYRTMMVAGLALLAVGMTGAGLFPCYLMVLLGLFLAGLGKSIFDPALQAYVGARVPFRRRGLVVGVMETAWAGSSFIGIPFLGLLMERFGWRSSFLFLGFMGISGSILLPFLFYRDQRQNRTDQALVHLFRSWAALFRYRPAAGVLGMVFLLSVANDNFFVIYGSWLEEGFHLSLVALGFSTSVIGFAELAGEGFTAFFGDRIGLKKALIAGLIVSFGGYGLLPLAETLFVALLFLFVVFLGVEISVVCAISLSTELLPGARATMMAGFMAAASTGRVFGALLGGNVWKAGGIGGISLVSVLLTAAGLGLLLWGLKEWRPEIHS
jgi:MFS transporter, DHA1 family, inner membrane transport protein